MFHIYHKKDLISHSPSKIPLTSTQNRFRTTFKHTDHIFQRIFGEGLGHDCYLVIQNLRAWFPSSGLMICT